MSDIVIEQAYMTLHCIWRHLPAYLSRLSQSFSIFMIIRNDT